MIGDRKILYGNLATSELATQHLRKLCRYLSDLVRYFVPSELEYKVRTLTVEFEICQKLYIATNM